MKRILAIIVILSLICTRVYSLSIQEDKKKHAAACFTITSSLTQYFRTLDYKKLEKMKTDNPSLYMICNKAKNNPKKTAVLITLMIGILKELVHDKAMGLGCPDIQDMEANVVGIVAACLADSAGINVVPFYTKNDETNESIVGIKFKKEW